MNGIIILKLIYNIKKGSGTQVVFLEEFRGYFAVKFLQQISY